MNKAASRRGAIVLTLAILLSVLLPLPATSQVGTVRGKTPAELFPWATFDPGVPTQEDVTGVVPGSRPLRHAEVMRYLAALAGGSPRASLQTYTRSHEGRELVLFAVSDEDTMADLEGFRQKHLRQVDARRGSDAVDEGAQAVAWLGYGIHGDELSSTDAAAAVAYYLVAGEDARARALRAGLVVLIDPMQNPDGRERYLAMTASFAHKVPNPDQDDLSHTTVWPQGRGNHYLFDLNRDFFSMVHPESERAARMASWLPQLVVDSHEMGNDSSYLFSPPRDPDNPHGPDYQRKWWRRYGADQGRALDQRGYTYFTGEWNEEFFAGYGSTWPTFHGAIGILYEMSGTDGTLVRRSDGTTRTYAEAVEHHVTSSLANLETLASNRAEMLADFAAGRRTAMTEPRGPARAWLLPPGDAPERADALAALLRRQGLEVHRATDAVRVSGLRDARTGETSARELPAGTWMVALDQPSSPLARVLLDPHLPMPASYLREERESVERGEGSRLYDTTAWSLPLLYGVEAYWTAQKPAGPWDAGGAPAAVPGTVGEGDALYGYVLDGRGEAAMGALAELLQKGFLVQAAEKEFTVDGRSYGRGSLVLRREGNPDELGEHLRPIAERWGVTFDATSTADSSAGPDLGGSHFLALDMPRVGVVAGMGVSPSDYGSIWYVLDERVALRFNGLDVTRLGSVELERYNVLVFPPGRGYSRILGQEVVEALKTWVKNGGTVIGVSNGADFLADTSTELTRTRLRRQALKDFPPLVLGAHALAAEAAAPMRAVGLRSDAGTTDGEATLGLGPMIGAGASPFVQAVPASKFDPVPLDEWLKPTLPAGRDTPSDDEIARADTRLRRFGPRGAIVRVELDERHWLNWGLGAEASVLLRASDTFVADGDGAVDVTARFPAPERLHLGGLLWPEAAGRLAHTAFATRERHGKGQVVLFLDHPTYRAWTHETQRMFVNAILYGPGLGTRSPTPW